MVNICLIILFQLGMTEFTPAGLLEGAKAIVTHNRELRNNVQQLEQSVNELQIQQFSLVGII